MDFFTFLPSFTPFTSFPPKIFVQWMSLWVMWPETGEHWWDAFTSAAQRSTALESANSLVCVLNQLSQLRGDTHVHHSSSHAQQRHEKERNKSHCHKHNYTKLWGCIGQEGKATMQTATKKAFLRKGSVGWTNSYQIVGGKTEMWLERLSVRGRAGKRKKKGRVRNKNPRNVHQKSQQQEPVGEHKKAMYRQLCVSTFSASFSYFIMWFLGHFAIISNFLLSFEWWPVWLFCIPGWEVCQICYHINKEDFSNPQLYHSCLADPPFKLANWYQVHSSLQAPRRCFSPRKDAQIIDSALSASSFRPLASLFSPTLPN